MKKYALAVAALLALGTAQTASAEVSVGISIGVPGIIYPAPDYYYAPPPPVYYAPPPVVVVPRPMYAPVYGWRGGHRDRVRYNQWRSHGDHHWKGNRGRGKHDRHRDRD